MNQDDARFGAECLFLHRDLSRIRKYPCTVERITLVRARGFSEALRKGEPEARRDARKPKTVADYPGFITVDERFDRRMKGGAEVFSSLRSLSVPKKTFITRYTDGGTFRCRTWQEQQS